jgi:hypothetical protein
LKGIDRVKEETLIMRMSSLQRTRQAENPWNMARKGSRTDIRQNSYSVRVVEKWNSLPREMKRFETRMPFDKHCGEEPNIKVWKDGWKYQKCENLLEIWQEKSNNRLLITR